MKWEGRRGAPRGATGDGAASAGVVVEVAACPADAVVPQVLPAIQLLAERSEGGHLLWPTNSPPLPGRGANLKTCKWLRTKNSDPAPGESGRPEAAVYSRPHRTQTSTFALPGERNGKGEGGRYLKHKGSRQGELEINTKNARKKCFQNASSTEAISAFTSPRIH